MLEAVTGPAADRDHAHVGAQRGHLQALQAATVADREPGDEERL